MGAKIVRTLINGYDKRIDNGQKIMRTTKEQRKQDELLDKVISEYQRFLGWEQRDFKAEISPEYNIALNEAEKALKNLKSY
jgi:hypothetical protein